MSGNKIHSYLGQLLVETSNITTFTRLSVVYAVTCITVAREQLSKHVLAKKISWPTIGKGLSIARQRTYKQPSAARVTTISDVYC
jgi:hypothetical protein